MRSLSRRGDGSHVSFRVTDGKTDIAVVYHGILPDLFREGQGVVAEGRLRAGRRLCRLDRARQARRKIHAARGRRRAEKERALAGGRRPRSRRGAAEGRTPRPLKAGSGHGAQARFSAAGGIVRGVADRVCDGARARPGLVALGADRSPGPRFRPAGPLRPGEGAGTQGSRRRVTLVNFFASWCPPCREEQGALAALARRPGVTLDGIAYKDKPEDARRFLDQLGNPFNRVGIDRDGTTAINFGLYGVPETYVVDASGHIRYRQVGPLSGRTSITRSCP